MAIRAGEEMRRAARLLQFFRVVSPLPRLLVATFGTATTAAVGLIAIDPSRAAAALKPLLLLQLFAASSGFLVPARRGHYDLLLTTGEGRLQIAAAHWIMSILPGVVCWFVVAVAETVMTRGAQVSTVASGSVTAVIIVSTLPWALNVALPRFAAAIGWLVTLALCAVAVSTERAVHPISSLSGLSAVEAAAASLLWPAVLVGDTVTGDRGLIVAPALCIACGAVICALVTVSRRDIPLEAAQ